MFSEADESIDLGDSSISLDKVFSRVYDQIHSLAARVRWSGSNPTLNPTALVHEAYLKMRKNPPDFTAKSNAEIISAFANAMHQILRDAGRRKQAHKRVVQEAPDRTDLPIEDALTVAAAVEALEQRKPLQARIVQCRFLLGMTVDETAAALRLSKRSVEREWQEAKPRLAANVGSET